MKISQCFNSNSQCMQILFVRNAYVITRKLSSSSTPIFAYNFFAREPFFLKFFERAAFEGTIICAKFRKNLRWSNFWCFTHLTLPRGSRAWDLFNAIYAPVRDDQEFLYT